MYTRVVNQYQCLFYYIRNSLLEYKLKIIKKRKMIKTSSQVQKTFVKLKINRNVNNVQINFNLYSSISNKKIQFVPIYSRFTSAVRLLQPKDSVTTF